MPTFSFARRIARRLRALWRRRTAVIELTEAEKRFLSTREQILLHRNPQLLLQEMREPRRARCLSSADLDFAGEGCQASAEIG
jgi:hypothetical protein